MSTEAADASASSQKGGPWIPLESNPDVRRYFLRVERGILTLLAYVKVFTSVRALKTQPSRIISSNVTMCTIVGNKAWCRQSSLRGRLWS